MAPTHNVNPDLTSWFGSSPGSDRILIEWDSMRGWFRELERKSPRLHVESIGQTPRGAEMDLLIISAAEVISDLPSIRQQRSSLTNPGLLTDPEYANGQRAGTRPVVLITAGIHATEVGGVQLMPELVRDLALSDDPEITRWLDDLIILIVPTLNPDGMIGVHDWFMRTLGTPSEGTTPPWLYHPYAGHDNNRDWYTHALSETRLVIDHVHRPWRPHIVVDLHQMGHHAPRYVIPPYIDPAEPNVHPLIQSLSGEIGSVVATTHRRAGHKGVSSGVPFDGYSPSRAYQHYHGGVRILAEAASARIASPIEVNVDEVKPRRGFDPNLPSIHNPQPWPGGTWRLRDIMDYHRTTIDAVLDHVADHAAQWVHDQWTMLADEILREDEALWVIAPLKQQVDPAATVKLVEIMQRGDVQVEVADQSADGISRGSFVIRSGQPFGSYARALLDLAPYPVPRPEKDNAQPANPYDVTSHCLPLHMGVEIQRADPGIDIVTRPIESSDLVAFDPPSSRDVDRTRWLAIDPRGHQSITVVLNALRNGASVRRLSRMHVDANRLLAPGTWLVSDDHVFAAMSDAYRRNVRAWLIRSISDGWIDVSIPRIAMHMPSRTDAIDAGWLRLALDQLQFPYTIVSDTDIRTGILREFDVLLLAHSKPKDLVEGNKKDEYPAEYAGGLGPEGVSAIGQFLHHGGHVIAIDGATRALVQHLELPVDLPLESLSGQEFSAPGSVLRLAANPALWQTMGMDEPIPVMFEDSTAFRLRSNSGATSVARYANEDLLLSGWIHGEGHLHGTSAIIEVPHGNGRITGFGFRPHYRTQLLASMTLLSNAIMSASDQTPNTPKGPATTS